MAETSDQKMKAALEEVLKEFGISLEAPSDQEDDKYSDYSEIISKTQQKLDDLNEKGEELLKKAGMSREQLELYASNPANFTPEQWDALQKLKATAEEFKRQTSSFVSENETGKTIERKQKKQQHRFGKKKHWIPL